MLSSQSREFRKYFAQLIVAAMVFADFFPAKLFFTKLRKKYFHDISDRFRIIRFNYFCKKMRNFANKFAKGEQKFSHFFAKALVCWKPYELR